MGKFFSVIPLFFPFILFGQGFDYSALKTVDSLMEVARTLTNAGNFNKALELNTVAENLALEKWTCESAAYAKTCANHAIIYFYQWNYEEARNWYLKAKDIQEKILEKTDPEYAATLNSLGNLYLSMGNYELAEPLFIQARTIWKENPGKESGYYAWNAESLGSLHQAMNNYEKAELYYKEARDIRKKITADSAGYAVTLCSLASLYMLQMHKPLEAKTLYLEAKAIQEKLGEENADYAHTLDGLAVLYDDYLKDAEQAELLYLQVKSIRAKLLGENHPDYGWSLGNLGNFYWYSGKYKQAEPLLVGANDLWNNTLGKTHPNYIWSLHKLWALYWSMGKYAEATQYWLEMSNTEKKLLLVAAHYFSADELSSYTRKFQDGLNEGFSFAGVQADITGTCYDNLLFYKGFLLNTIAQVHTLALTDTTSTAQFHVLQACERRLAAEYAKPLAEQESVAKLEVEANTLEKDLTRRVAGLGEALRQVNWREVQQKLQPGEAAIEFVHYSFVNPRPTDSIMYAALLLRGDTQPPIFIRLFAEKQLQNLLQIQDKSKANYINTLYSVSQNTALYELIWQPLEPQLSGIHTVYFSPSGLLHYVNLAAMPVPRQSRGASADETLADRYHLVTLGSTRQLANVEYGIQHTKFASATSALLYGGIRYEMDTVAMAQAIHQSDAAAPTPPAELGFGNTDPNLRGGKWNYLQWTDVEVKITESLLTDAGLQPIVRRTYAATEESFKTIGNGQPSPRILHLATHGFFFPDPGSQAQGVKNQAQDPIFKISDHPMIRSGLVLAGGNYAWKTGRPFRADREDGILTAYEISQMNLRNTELVVLSACETGLGDIQGNEGVYGLQRAFKIAGAKYLIMSLWQIPDYQTQELMTTFYTKWLIDKMTIPAAFHAAQKAMREKYKDPFLWAGFVLVE